MYNNGRMDKTNCNKPDKVFNNSVDKKPLRYSTDSFVKELIGKKIRIGLINGDTFQGSLKELGMYDVKVALTIEDKTNIGGKEIIRNITKDRIFFKSAIIWVEVVS